MIVLDQGGAGFNVKAYGALGDGATDDRQKIVDTATAAGSGGLIFGPGTYLVNTNLTINNEVQLEPGAMLRPAAGVTITINRFRHAGNRQVFDLSLGGSVVFGTSATYNAVPQWWGAPDDYTGDATAAFQAWAVCGAKALRLPSGTYDVRGNVPLTSATRVNIRGGGLGTSIYFNPAAHDTSLFSATSGDNYVFEGFQVYNNNNQSKSGIVAFSFATSEVSALTFRNVYIQGFDKNAIVLDSAQYLLVDRCRFMETRKGGGTPAEAIRVNTFLNAANILNSRFTGNDKSIRVNTTTSSNAIRIAGCSFEAEGNGVGAFVDNTIEIDNARGITFQGNYVEGCRTGDGHAFLRLDACKGGDISGNMFSGNLGGTTYTYRFIQTAISNVGITAHNNHFEDVNTLFIDTAGTLRAYDNTYKNGGSDITTYNTLRTYLSTTVEVNNFFVQTIVDVPSIASGASYESADSTMTGARLGDLVQVSSNAHLLGMSLTGFVSSADNVRFVIQNLTGSAQNLPSAVFTYRLIRQT